MCSCCHCNPWPITEHGLPLQAATSLDFAVRSQILLLQSFTVDVYSLSYLLQTINAAAGGHFRPLISDGNAHSFHSHRKESYFRAFPGWHENPFTAQRCDVLMLLLQPQDLPPQTEWHIFLIWLIKLYFRCLLLFSFEPFIEIPLIHSLLAHSHSFMYAHTYTHTHTCMHFFSLHVDIFDLFHEVSDADRISKSPSYSFCHILLHVLL